MRPLLVIRKPKPKRHEPPTPRVGILRSAAKALAQAHRVNKRLVPPKPRFVKG